MHRIIGILDVVVHHLLLLPIIFVHHVVLLLVVVTYHIIPCTSDRGRKPHCPIFGRRRRAPHRTTFFVVAVDARFAFRFPAADAGDTTDGVSGRRSNGVARSSVEGVDDVDGVARRPAADQQQQQKNADA